MIPKLILASLITVSFAFSNFAVAEAVAEAAAAPVENHSKSVKAMKKFDNDNDSQISEVEFLANSKEDEAKKTKKTKTFKKLDLDGDGFLSYTELNAKYNK